MAQEIAEVERSRAIHEADRAISAVLTRVAEAGEKIELATVTWDGRSSNDVYEIRLLDGRAIMLKRARHEWARSRFAASCRAAALLRAHTELAVPRPIELPEEIDERPLHAYWRIQLPTLDRVWATLDDRTRLSTVDSLGALLRSVHGIPTPTWGALRSDGSCTELRDFLGWDLGGRLLPALHAHWPEVSAPVEALRQLVPTLVSRLEGRTPTLAHNDVHMGNVLCRKEGEAVHCVGLLDLEASCSLPPESDAASLLVMHGPHFERLVERRWRVAALRAHGLELDPWAIGFFEAMHLANLGFHSALLGHGVHAARVATALHRAVDRL